MSLAIHEDNVVGVCLADGRWYVVQSTKGQSSFLIDSYEFLSGSDDSLVLGGGGEDLIPSRGFGFVDAESGDFIAGPLTAIVAVRTKG